MSKSGEKEVKTESDRYAYELRSSEYGGRVEYLIVDYQKPTKNGPGIIAYCNLREQAIKIVDALNQYEEAEDG